MSTKREQIFDGIKEHLTGRGIEASLVTLQASLSDDLDLDSLDTVELTLGIEKQFGVEIPDAELEELVTISDAIDLVERKLTVGA